MLSTEEAGGEPGPPALGQPAGTPAGDGVRVRQRRGEAEYEPRWSEEDEDG